mgnify:FL=1
MIDFHCHVLMGIDDGSRNIETSIAMLEASKEQGVCRIVCTPHFDAARDRLEDFLLKRENAFRALQKWIDASDTVDIQLYPAAEILFFRHISEVKELEKLTIQGANVLLLEMPFDVWEDSCIREIEELCRKYRVVLVHLERYMNFRNRKYIRKVIEMTHRLPLYVQINCRSVAEGPLRKKLIKMFRKGDAHFLGSDSHNMTRRPPNMESGMKALEESLGSDFVEQLNQQNRRFLQDAWNEGYDN